MITWGYPLTDYISILVGLFYIIGGSLAIAIKLCMLCTSTVGKEKFVWGASDQINRIVQIVFGIALIGLFG